MPLNNWISTDCFNYLFVISPNFSYFFPVDHSISKQFWLYLFVHKNNKSLIKNNLGFFLLWKVYNEIIERKIICLEKFCIRSRMFGKWMFFRGSILKLKQKKSNNNKENVCIAVIKFKWGMFLMGSLLWNFFFIECF